MQRVSAFLRRTAQGRTDRILCLLASVAAAAALLLGLPIPERHPGWLVSGWLADLAAISLLAILVNVLHHDQRRITELNRRLQLQVSTDELTGLLNHRAVWERFDKLIDQATVTGEQFAAIMLDLDNFKSINDTYGHLAGDEVLRAMGRRLCDQIPAGAVAGRYGGDEFLVLLPGAGREAAATWASTFHGWLAERPFSLPGGEALAVGASLGAAIYPEDGQTSQSLYNAADRALYRHKARRKRSARAPQSSSPFAAGRVESDHGETVCSCSRSGDDVITRHPF